MRQNASWMPPDFHEFTGVKNGLGFQRWSTFWPIRLEPKNKKLITDVVDIMTGAVNAPEGLKSTLDSMRRKAPCRPEDNMQKVVYIESGRQIVEVFLNKSDILLDEKGL